MATNLEYALLAGHAYISTGSSSTAIPIPSGWIGGDFVSDTLNATSTQTSAGFEAGTYKRQNADGTKEVVISFAGSVELADWQADAQLGLGMHSDHLRQAALYYAEIKRDNPGATITLTGHSLGGGLASVLGVLFNEKAVTFDAAPFAASASTYQRDDLRSYLAEHGITSGVALSNLNGFTTLAGRESNVTGTYVQGEALALIPLVSRIGTQTMIPHGAADLSGAANLHSQALLIAFTQNDGYREISNKIPDAVRMNFDANLFTATTSLSNPLPGFLENLVRHQAGITDVNTGAVVVAPDKMLDRYTADLQKIGQDGGLTLTNNDLTKTLTAFSMQMYYENPLASGSNKTLFDTSGVTAGGLHFNRNDVAANLTDAKGYNLYFGNYLSSLPSNESALISSKLLALGDWYVQSGTSAMTATAVASTTGALMLGGTGNDVLTGSSSADVLYGGAGDDKLYGGAGSDALIGGAGNDYLDGGTGADVMLGGAGNDTYVVDSVNDTVMELSGGGTDTILSSVSLTLGDNLENLTLTGAAALTGTGNDANNVLTGNSSNNILSAGAGNDTLIGGKGNDTLLGSAGNDTYTFNRGDGKDTINDQDSYRLYKSTDTAQFTGASSYQLWFQHVGNDLVASTIGTSDSVTVKDWYSDGKGGTVWNAYLKTDSHIEQFKSSDGKLLLDSQVENLVQAMSAFAPPAAGQTSLPSTMLDALAPVIAANWKNA
jgi:Ca2+-binding RTX toxin-like protein